MTPPPVWEAARPAKNYNPNTLNTNTPSARTPDIFLNRSLFKAGMKTDKPYQRKNSQIHQLAREDGKFIFIAPIIAKFRQDRRLIWITLV